MGQVNTVRGPIDESDLGRTLMHEHIFVLSPEIEKAADEWDEAAEQARAVTKLRELKSRGIDTLVDLTVVGLSRSMPRGSRHRGAGPGDQRRRGHRCVHLHEVPMFFHFQGPGTILGTIRSKISGSMNETRSCSMNSSSTLA
jgi:phosphotriesterase-related protein